MQKAINAAILSSGWMCLEFVTCERFTHLQLLLPAAGADVGLI